ncbi:FKBP-type peptidyl-prolyl cis-trans isomerase [Haliscomenobacter sp.]|uniref:FKBP-type peptidyl-prolyl cis-trans isomerase n=1 Tax=Haliscomenobacter sp. TaxID=2717303 RepID=UPI003BAD50E8
MHTIQKNAVVTISYKIQEIGGEVLEESQEGFPYLHGGYENIFPKVETEFEGKPVGTKVEVDLAPADAYGERDLNLVRVESLSDLNIPGLQIGDMLEEDDEETGETIIWRVIAMKEDQVMLDHNHPLAGLGIRFSGEVLSIRGATAAEIEHGHVHDEHDSHGH